MNVSSAASPAVQHILLATDGSEFSDGAIRLGIELARRSGAKLTAMTMALAGDSQEGAGTHNSQASAEEQASGVLDTLAAQASRVGVTCERTIRVGKDPHREIVGAAEDVGADLIVMGRRGKRGLARSMVGDATAKVIGAAHCNVLVAPRVARMWDKCIVLGTDGSTFAEAATTVVARVAAQASVPVVVVSAVLDSFSDSRLREADAAVAHAKDVLAREGIAAQTIIVHARPDDAIIGAAQETDAELIVTGTHGRTGLGRFVLGSVTERVISGAPCAVLAVKPAR